MGYKPTENYAAKDFLESGDPDKIVMGRELQADFDAISEAFTETDNKLQDLDYVDLRGDTMTGPLITPEVIADDIIGGDVSADTVKATNFEGNGSGITGITVDQLADVSAPNPLRDQVLAYNGSAWESVTLDIVESDLSFKGPADLTQPVPAGAVDGDMYVGDTAGVVDASWNGIGGTTTSPGDFVAYSDADSRWFSLGSVSSGAVTSVGAGSGISVDSLQPTSPVVSVDRSDTDGWYADKTTTSDALTDINRDITATNLIVADNESDISDLRGDLTDEITARIDGDAELLALIQAARPGSTVTVGDDAPENPLEGDLWYCTLADSEGLFVWHDGAWLATDDEAGPVLWKPCDDGTFFDGGSVGVNTETPYSRLHVDGENTPKGGITLSSGGNYHTNYLKDSFVNVHDIESNSPNAAHTWAIDGDEKVRIAADGKVTLPEISVADVTVDNLTVNTSFTSPGIDDNANATAITIDANENVGIGTASPSTSLDIIRNGVQPLRLESTSGNKVSIRLANTGGNAFVEGVDNNIVIPSGNVGIGTDNPSTALEVNGIARINNYLSINNNGYIRGEYAGELRFQGGTTATTFYDSTNATEHMRISSAGKVGIGTTSPASKLSVNSGDDNTASCLRKHRHGLLDDND